MDKYFVFADNAQNLLSARKRSGMGEMPPKRYGKAECYVDFGIDIRTSLYGL